MDKKIGIYVIFLFLIEIYLFVEKPWLGAILGILLLTSLIVLKVRSKKKKEANLNHEIERIHKSRHTDE